MKNLFQRIGFFIGCILIMLLLPALQVIGFVVGGLSYMITEHTFLSLDDISDYIKICHETYVYEGKCIALTFKDNIDTRCRDLANQFIDSIDPFV